MGSTAQAAVPTTSSLEGVLLSSGGGPAADGNYTVTIGIYSAETGGNPVWAESGVTVAAKGGQFSYQLGSKTPLSAAALSLSKAWIGIQIGSDPELPRQAMASSPFALRAGVAEALECTGCLKAGNLDAAVLQPYAKSADLAPYAKTADLSGYAKTSDLGAYAKTSDLSTYAKASDLADYVKAASLAKVAGTGSYADLLNKPTLATVAASGSYADLTNKPVMAKLGDACGTNLVMKGLKADGSYECVTAGIAPDMINEISNDLIWNQFTDTMSGTKDVQIKDGFAAGVTDTLAFPDVGLTQKLWVDLNVSNSDVSKVVVELYGPGMSTPYLLYNGGKTGSAVVAKYNDGDALVSGDMNKDWLGKNIKGNWSITVKDTAAITVPPGTPAFVYDGKFNWSMSIQTLSSKKIQVKGNLIVDGSLSVGGAFTGTANGVCNTSNKGSIRYQSGGYQMCDGYVWINTLEPAMFRWATFSTYSQWNGAWYGGNSTALFGGVNPSNWTDGCHRAVHMSSTSEVLRTLLFKKGPRVGTVSNAMVYANEWYGYSSTNGQVVVTLFRIRNTTGSAVTWTPYWYGTSYGGWSECQGVAMNGNELWSTSNNYNANSSFSLGISIPANRTSTIIFTATSSPDSGTRATHMSFYNNSLALPAGLEYVDDLDVKPDGWNN
jgi:hypothetical protein